MITEDEVRSILTELFSLDVEQRHELVASHTELASDTTLDIVKRLLRPFGQQRDQSGIAAHLLVLIGSPEAISILEKEVTEPVFKSVLSGIVGAKNELALKLMLLALAHQHDSYDVISYFEDLIKEIGEAAIDPCLRYFENPDIPNEAKIQVLNTLSLIESDKLMPVLIKMALDSSGDLQSSAIEELGYLVLTRIIKPLHDQLSVANADVSETTRSVFEKWKALLKSI